MKKYRVLVIEGDSLFSDSIKLLLVLQENLEIVRTASSDLNAILAEIERTQPRVVIINDDPTTDNAQLILKMLKARSDLRVITLSLDGNRINVYDNREVTVTNIKDLVSIIAGDT